ncbi:glycosyltransferase [Lamprobacter modestohalophilus]|uniref:glycosyltransferase n=1 Tax=Lamprobacter modestohalophilus TaxID=1064514 RepID=UPI002ADECB42|nr:glycosyltransferase [Lamprobacter modestohalophilus]MEA1051478.1 glycosyltransferase [Lamprobacter modestohalophilus]
METAGISVHAPAHDLEPVPAADDEILAAASNTSDATTSIRRRLRRVRASVGPVIRRNHLLHVLIRSPISIGAKLVNSLALLRGYWAVIVPMAAFIRAQQADVVHCLLPNGYFYGTFATLLARRRCIVMSRLGLNVYQAQYPGFSRLERQVLHRLVRVAVGNAKRVLQELVDEGLPERKLFLLYNGIDTEAFRPCPVAREAARNALGLDPDAFVMSVVANLHPYKGHADLLRALALAHKQLALDWVLLVAGRDQLGQRAVCENLAAELGISAQVKFLGPRDDIAALLAASDLQVHPSHQEALPNSIIEAMAAELPVIATRVGGIPELIEDGVNGLLVEPQRPEALAAAIVQLSRAPDVRRAMGQCSGLKVREHFTLERSVERYQQLYMKVAGRSGAGPEHAHNSVARTRGG